MDMYSELVVTTERGGGVEIKKGQICGDGKESMGGEHIINKYIYIHMTNSWTYIWNLWDFVDKCHPNKKIKTQMQQNVNNN